MRSSEREFNTIRESYMHPYLLALAAMTVLAFGLYSYDKFCASRNMWRVPEKHLLALSLAGGAAGGLTAMLIFRHKTQKLYFYLAQLIGLSVHGFFVYAYV